MGKSEGIPFPRTSSPKGFLPVNLDSPKESLGIPRVKPVGTHGKDLFYSSAFPCLFSLSQDPLLPFGGYWGSRQTLPLLG